MKKLLVLIIVFFSFTACVNALDVDNLQIDIYINYDGSASVVEQWKLDNVNIFDRYIDSKFKIKDLTVSGEKKEFTYVNICELNNEYTYCNNDEYIKIRGNNKSDTITIIYLINDFVVKFNDRTGLYLDVLPVKNDINIDSLSVDIKSDVKFLSTNTILYGIGDNVSVSIENGDVLLKGEDIKSNQKLILLANFDNDILFENYYEIDDDFENIYNEEIKKDSLFAKLLKMVKKELFLFLIIIVVVIVLFYLVNRFLLDKKNRDTYHNIVLFDDKPLPMLNEVPYYESVPCNGDLLKISFLGGYFDIIKNKSNIIGAYIFKWICEGRVIITDNKLRFSSKLMISNKYEKALYSLLYKASKNGILDEKRLNNFVDDNCEEFLNWFIMIDRSIIDAEISKDNIKKMKKKLVLNEKIYDDAVDILGVKRYLLHFNQVPRSLPLNENTYKSLLVCAILLGISEDVSKEILRKNSDNIFADKLLEFTKMSVFYKGIYQRIKNKVVLVRNNNDVEE